jgi:hypothetical protein
MEAPLLMTLLSPVTKFCLFTAGFPGLPDFPVILLEMF